MASVAIITARGGSKRIPKKNIKDFLGFPIIKYSIDAGKEYLLMFRYGQTCSDGI
jgi:N-acylneuraminate cytidylyltransferase